MAEINVLERTKNHVAHIVINRPDARNALNQATIKDLTAAFAAAAANRDVHAILLYGAGDEAFCAGADLRELQALKTAAQRKTFFSALAKLISLMEHCPKTIIAKVHGFALAGGCGLVAACDLAYASEEAAFGLPEVNIGLAPLVVLAPVVRAIGHRAAADLVLTGERITALQALDLCLVSRVFPKADLHDQVERIAEIVASKSPAALAAAKAALKKVDSLTVDAALTRFPAEIAALAGGPEAIEGISAHLEKRAPQWPVHVAPRKKSRK